MKLCDLKPGTIFRIYHPSHHKLGSRRKIIESWNEGDVRIRDIDSGMSITLTDENEWINAEVEVENIDP